MYAPLSLNKTGDFVNQRFHIYIYLERGIETHHIQVH